MIRILFLALALAWGGIFAFPLEVNLLEVNLTVAPGQVHTFTFIARNERTVPETFTVYVGDWDRDEFGNNRFFEPGTIERSLCGWLVVSPTSFTLKPGEIREVVGTLTVPDSAPEGTYWGIVFVQGEPRLIEQEGTRVLAVQRIGVKVYATVGRGKRDGRITNIEVRGLSPLWLLVKFANAGTRNLDRVTGWVEVFDAQGKLLAKNEFEPFSVLPGSARWVRVDTELRLSAGVYLVMAVADIGADFLLAGRRQLRIPALTLEPLTESEKLPQDLDSDGLYEDINGDGVFNLDDVLTFLRVFDTPAIQRNWWSFDFNNDGVVDWADVLRLQEMLGP